jgi:hypothetical protein
VQKGNSFSGQYTEAVIATVTDWTGTASVYQTFPGGSAIFSVALSLSGDNTKLLFTLPTEQIQNLDAGLYYVVGNMKSTILSIDTYRMDYMTVTSAAVGAEPMTTLTMTIAKVDGTPAGKETRILTNTVDGAVVTLGWDGVQVTASHPIADEVSGNIIGTETVTTKTNAAGYAQLAVIKGQTVTVSCPAFGKTVEVNTTGLNTIDLSAHF